MSTLHNSYSEVFPATIYEGWWDKLTIANHIVFGSVMMRPDLCKRLIEISLQMPIDHIEYVQHERDIHAFAEAPGVRLDVYAGDGSGRVFNVELQRRDEKNLPQRTRFYQASISYEMADRARAAARREGRYLSWNERYGSLREAYVIFICLRDPFDRGWMRYVFKNICTNDPTLALNDGTCCVYLNANWKVPSNNNEKSKDDAELEALLSYFAGKYDGTDEFVRTLDQEVRATIMRPEWRKHIMLQHELWEDATARLQEESRELGLKEGREKGLAEGREKGLAEGREKGLAEGRAEGREKGLAEGRAEGIAEGLEKGLEKGSAAKGERDMRLAKALQNAGRLDEVVDALKDEATFERLWAELGL